MFFFSRKYIVFVMMCCLSFFSNPPETRSEVFESAEKRPSVYQEYHGVDDNYHALYGAYGAQIKHVITRVDIDPAVNPFGGRDEFMAQKKKLNDFLYEEVSKTIPKEADIKFYRSYISSRPEKDSEVSVIGFRVIFKKIDEEKNAYLLILDPVNGRYAVGLEYPYSSYENADASIFYPDKEDLLDVFKQVAEPKLLREMKRVGCSRIIDRNIKFCAE